MQSILAGVYTPAPGQRLPPLGRLSPGRPGLWVSGSPPGETNLPCHTSSRVVREDLLPSPTLLAKITPGPAKAPARRGTKRRIHRDGDAGFRSMARRVRTRSRAVRHRGSAAASQAPTPRAHFKETPAEHRAYDTWRRRAPVPRNGDYAENASRRPLGLGEWVTANTPESVGMARGQVTPADEARA